MRKRLLETLGTLETLLSRATSSTGMSQYYQYYNYTGVIFIYYIVNKMIEFYISLNVKSDNFKCNNKYIYIKCK